LDEVETHWIVALLVKETSRLFLVHRDHSKKPEPEHITAKITLYLTLVMF
jgi:hypothetical protein